MTGLTVQHFACASTSEYSSPLRRSHACRQSLDSLEYRTVLADLSILYRFEVSPWTPLEFFPTVILESRRAMEVSEQPLTGSLTNSSHGVSVFQERINADSRRLRAV